MNEKRAKSAPAHRLAVLTVAVESPDGSRTFVSTRATRASAGKGSGDNHTENSPVGRGLVALSRLVKGFAVDLTDTRRGLEDAIVGG